MKKLMASVLALVCVVAMAGCGKSNVGGLSCDDNGKWDKLLFDR